MKVFYPLSLKISLWLLLNLALLAGAGAVFYWSQFGRGWQSLTVGALGDRLQAVADGVMTEITNAAPEEHGAVLAARSQSAGVQMYLFHNDGPQLLGPAVTLPPPIAEDLRRGRRGPRGGFERAAPAPSGTVDDALPPPKRGPLGGGRPPGIGRMVFRDAEHAETWIGLRVPYHAGAGLPQPATLIIRAQTALGIIHLLDLLPWLGLIVGVFALSIVFWLPLVAGITRSLRQLDRATEAIAQGKFDTRVNTGRRDEIGHLAESVNRMAARLDTLVNGQKRFLGDIAHELGSPLGRLQVATEILETRADPALRDHVSDVREEVQQMASLVDELLAFTKAGLRPRDAELAAVDLDPLFQEVIAREDPTSRVLVSPAPGIHVLADRTLLARALGNLVRNALRYAGEHAAIGLQWRADATHVTVTVEDNGPGVPAAALDRLGEPFYRPELARTRETGGVGLGLAIVRSAAAACGGDAQFANRKPHGFRVDLRLRRAT